MLRRLLIVASLASLLLCVTTALLWAGSYWRGVEFVWPAEQTFDGFLYNEDLGSSYEWDGMLQSAHARGGFAAERRPLPGAASEFLIAAPCWFLTLAFAILPCGWVVLRIRRRRTENDGRCATCGYDLRASTDRCPECGKPIRDGAMA
jgi:hypothetical protein